MRFVLHRPRICCISAILGFAAFAAGFASQAAEPAIGIATAGKKYTATAFLLVERHEPHILPRAAEQDDPAEYVSYCVLQMQMIKSRYVLSAVLRDPKVQSLPSIVREDARHNAMEWLRKEIRVECPDQRTGILSIGLTSNDPNEAVALVNAVIAGYSNEVVAYERQRRRSKLEELQLISAEKENEVRTKKSQLKRELETIGIAASPAEAEIRQRLSTDKCLLLQKELLTLKDEYNRANGELKVQKALAGDTKKLEAQIDNLRNMVAAQEKEYERARTEAVAETHTSVAAEMAADDLRVIEETLHAIAEERETLKVELKANPRVTVLGDRNAPATVTESPQ